MRDSAACMESFGAGCEVPGKSAGFTSRVASALQPGLQARTQHLIRTVCKDSRLARSVVPAAARGSRACRAGTARRGRSAAGQRARCAEFELASILERLHEVAFGSPEIHEPAAYLQQIESHLLDLFSATMTNAPISHLARPTAPVPRMQLVRRASDIMYARLGEPLRVGTICREIGCDWKTLERAFLTVIGVAPKQFLTMARLSTARRKLLGAPPDATVTSVALRCGMHHLGRFSTKYRRMFGESPSETLASANR